MEEFKKGDKINKFTFVEELPRSKCGMRRVKVRCFCGNIVNVQLNNIKLRGETKTCGCSKKGGNPTHGMSSTNIYNSWRSLRQRCSNKNNREYHNYGGRGIKVCDRWINSFENFYKDMGKRPKGKSIDRIDYNGNYEPENCRWATREEQDNNKRNNHFIEYRGEKKTLAQWSRKLKGGNKLVYDRIRAGWSNDRAVTEKPKYL